MESKLKPENQFPIRNLQLASHWLGASRCHGKIKARHLTPHPCVAEIGLL